MTKLTAEIKKMICIHKLCRRKSSFTIPFSHTCRVYPQQLSLIAPYISRTRNSDEPQIPLVFLAFWFCRCLSLHATWLTVCWVHWRVWQSELEGCHSTMFVYCFTIVSCLLMLYVNWSVELMLIDLKFVAFVSGEAWEKLCHEVCFLCAINWLSVLCLPGSQFLIAIMYYPCNGKRFGS